ncbi:MAG TPA: hypothetical protein VNZ52_00335 [Candidatus Thermoplasmatota archaeon]|nr:hypothetical protein [Candidatus Thermoplasmatota archaeon]
MKPTPFKQYPRKSILRGPLAILISLLLVAGAAAAAGTSSPTSRDPSSGLVEGAPKPPPTGPADCKQTKTCELVYDPATGNRKCSEAEIFRGSDTDGDGTPDCDDPDDDNDFVSDEVEDVYFQLASAKTDRDMDDDGILDGFDMLPFTPTGNGGLITISIRIVDYADNGPTPCDQNSLHDPYIRSWVVYGIPSNSYSLPVPKGWRLDDHVDNRGSGKVSDGAVPPFPLSPDIREWDINMWQAPRLTITTALYDHDDGPNAFFDPDDAIDITSGSPPGANRAALTTDGAGKVTLAGSSKDCSAKLTLEVIDSALAAHVRIAVAALSKGAPVTTGDLGKVY